MFYGASTQHELNCATQPREDQLWRLGKADERRLLKKDYHVTTNNRYVILCLIINNEHDTEWVKDARWGAKLYQWENIRSVFNEQE